MEDLRYIFTLEEIASIFRFLGPDGTVQDLIDAIDNRQFNPIYTYKIVPMLERLRALTPGQRHILEVESRRISNTQHTSHN